MHSPLEEGALSHASRRVCRVAVSRLRRRSARCCSCRPAVRLGNLVSAPKHLAVLTELYGHGRSRCGRFKLHDHEQGTPQSVGDVDTPHDLPVIQRLSGPRGECAVKCRGAPVREVRKAWAGQRGLSHGAKSLRVISGQRRGRMRVTARRGCTSPHRGGAFRCSAGVAFRSLAFQSGR